MIDIHTHILPGIDDGAETPEQAVEILLQLKEQGITRVLLTPHFCPQSQSLDSFLESRQASYEQLLAAKGLPKDIELILSAELQLHDAIFNYENLDALKIPGTSYVLTELPAGFIANKAGVRKSLSSATTATAIPFWRTLSDTPNCFAKKICSTICSSMVVSCSSVWMHWSAFHTLTKSASSDYWHTKKFMRWGQTVTI